MLFSHELPMIEQLCHCDKNLPWMCSPVDFCEPIIVHEFCFASVHQQRVVNHNWLREHAFKAERCIECLSSSTL